MGDDHRGLRHLLRSVPIRAETDPHGRQPDHQAEPDARLLRRALGGGDRDRRVLAGAAGEFHPYRRGRRLRRGLLPRMVRGEYGCRGATP